MYLAALHARAFNISLFVKPVLLLFCKYLFEQLAVALANVCSDAAFFLFDKAKQAFKCFLGHVVVEFRVGLFHKWNFIIRTYGVAPVLAGVYLVERLTDYRFKLVVKLL